MVHSPHHSPNHSQKSNYSTIEDWSPMVVVVQARPLEKHTGAAAVARWPLPMVVAPVVPWVVVPRVVLRVALSVVLPVAPWVVVAMVVTAMPRVVVVPPVPPVVVVVPTSPPPPPPTPRHPCSFWKNYNSKAPVWRKNSPSSCLSFPCPPRCRTSGCPSLGWRLSHHRPLPGPSPSRPCCCCLDS